MTDTSTPPELKEAQQAALSQKAKQTLTRIVELLTVFGLLGFLGSTLLNGYVFAQWGLSFLQVASLSDVIMSGIQLSIDLASISIIAVAGYVAGKVLYRFCPRRIESEKRAKTANFAYYLRVNCVALMTLGSVPLIIYVLSTGIGSIYVLNAIALGVGFIVGNVNTSKYWLGASRRS